MTTETAQAQYLLTLRELFVAFRMAEASPPPALALWAEEFGLRVESDVTGEEDAPAFDEALASLLARGHIYIAPEAVSLTPPLDTVLAMVSGPEWKVSLYDGQKQVLAPDAQIFGSSGGSAILTPTGNGGIVIRSSDDGVASLKDVLDQVGVEVGSGDRRFEVVSSTEEAATILESVEPTERLVTLVVEQGEPGSPIVISLLATAEQCRLLVVSDEAQGSLPDDVGSVESAFEWVLATVRAGSV